MELERIDKKQLLERIKPDQNGNFSLTELWKLTSNDVNTAPARWQQADNVQGIQKNHLLEKRHYSLKFQILNFFFIATASLRKSYMISIFTAGFVVNGSIFQIIALLTYSTECPKNQILQ